MRLAVSSLVIFCITLALGIGIAQAQAQNNCYKGNEGSTVAAPMTSYISIVPTAGSCPCKPSFIMATVIVVDWRFTWEDSDGTSYIIASGTGASTLDYEHPIGLCNESVTFNMEIWDPYDGVWRVDVGKMFHVLGTRIRVGSSNV